MAARALLLAGVALALAAAPGAALAPGAPTAVATPSEPGSDSLPAPALASAGAAPAGAAGPADAPVPPGLPGGLPLDTGPSASPDPAPVAPDLVAPSEGLDAGLLAAGLGAALGLAGLAVWGGTRFRTTEEVLRHELRSRIYKHVETNVGASLKDITEALGLSTTNAVWHLRKLEDSGLLRGRKFNGAKVYYPTSGGVQARNLSLAGAALTSANARSILQFVAGHPGVHQREVARLIAVNHGTVRWHLKKLRDAELLEERRSGAVATYHATALGHEALRAHAARSMAQVAAGVPQGTALAPPASQA